MGNQAVYANMGGGNYGIYAVGIGNRLGDELLGALEQRNIDSMLRRGRIDDPLVEIIVVKGRGDPPAYVGAVTIDHKLFVSPSAANEVFMVDGDPNIQLLQRANTIAIAASDKKVLDHAFYDVVKATNFFPVRTYEGVDAIANGVLDELLKAYEANDLQQIVLGKRTTEIESLRKLRSEEIRRQQITRYLTNQANQNRN